MCLMPLCLLVQGHTQRCALNLFNCTLWAFNILCAAKIKSSQIESAHIPAKQRVSGLLKSHVAECALETQVVHSNRSNFLWGAIAGTMRNLVVRGGLKPKSFRFTWNYPPSKEPIGICVFVSYPQVAVRHATVDNGHVSLLQAKKALALTCTLKICLWCPVVVLDNLTDSFTH